jgi:hypothetical protein
MLEFSTVRDSKNSDNSSALSADCSFPQKRDRQHMGEKKMREKRGFIIAIDGSMEG